MDIRHYYVEKGRGEPLVLLHGNGESSEYFTGQIDVFSAQYHVYALDTRGHGKTPRGEGRFTLSRFADDLLAFLDAHGIQKTHLLGFSDGGNIALLFAMAHPERVGKLILNGANLDPSGVSRLFQAPIELGFKIASRFAGKSESAKHNAEMLGLMVNEPHIPPAALSGIRSPTLVIAGTRDLIRAGHIRLIADSIPDAKLVFLRGDHFVARKNAPEFNRTVLDFLGGRRTHPTDNRKDGSK